MGIGVRGITRCAKACAAFRRRLLVLCGLLTQLGSPQCARAQAVVDSVSESDVVVLVHGMGRTPLSMTILGNRLRERGYRVVNWGYSSYSGSVAELGTALGARVRAEAGDARRIHFVGHSLGNVLIRWMIVHQRPERMGRVVMLAPPNRGSHSADRYARWLGWLLRPMPELRTSPSSTVRRLGTPAGTEIGIIAGASDGKVNVAETHLAGAADHVVVPAAHTFIMNRKDVLLLILHFLENGRFRGTPPVLSEGCMMRASR